MPAPAHLFSCASCSHMTFTHYAGAFDHILYDPTHEPDRDKIRRQFGLDGERECIHRMISVLLIADNATASSIKDSARGRAPGSNAPTLRIDKFTEQSNFLFQVLAREPAPAVVLRTRVKLLHPHKYAAQLAGDEYYFLYNMALQPVPTRAALLVMIADRFGEDWVAENQGGDAPPVVDWSAAADACCAMTIKMVGAGPVRVKLAGDRDVQRLAEIGADAVGMKGIWTLVIGG